MEINNANTLLNQINAGANFKISDQGQLSTQSKVGAFFQRFADAFRSDTTIAARNERLTMAMSQIMQGNPALGPQNLAAAPPMNAAERQDAVNVAKATVAAGMVKQQIEQAFPNATPRERTIMSDFASRFMRGNPTGITRIPATVQGIKSMAAGIMTTLNKPEVQTSLRVLTPALRGPEELQTQMAALSENLQNGCLEDRSELKKDGSRARYDDNNMYYMVKKDFSRDRPVIDGVRPMNQDAIPLLATFSPNINEREVLSYLLTQTSLAGTIGMVGNPAKGLGAQPGDLFLQLSSVAGAPRYSLDRNEQGDAVVHVTMGLTVQGELEGAGYNQATPSMLKYDVVVPHAQFGAQLATAVQPDIQVANMRIMARD